MPSKNVFSALILIALAALAACRPGAPPVEPGPSPPSEREAGWRMLPASPIPSRAGHSAVWTGTEAIYWGGYTPVEGNFPYHNDGAAFDPESNAWRKISSSPLPPRFEHAAVWTGSEMIVWGGFVPEEGGGSVAAYDPETDKWRLLADPPIGHNGMELAIWTGQELVAWGSAPVQGPQRTRLAALDPDSNTWRRLPDGPAMTPRRAAFTGDSLIFWSALPPRSENDEIIRNALFVFGFRNESWNQASPAPLEGRDAASFIWTGAEAIVWGGAAEPGINYADGASYDPAGDRWSDLPPAPIEARFDHAAVWTGEVMVVWGGFRDVDESFGDGATFVPSTDRWDETGPAGSLRGMYPALWTGTEMIVWDGFQGGMIYRP